MNNTFLMQNVDRAKRRILLKEEARRRRDNRWGEWETFDISHVVLRKGGWLSECKMLHRNKVFSVLRRPLDNGVEHFAIGSLSDTRPTWHEMQRIKDELAGPYRTAVEVYPPKHEIVDGANMFHIWILAEPLPFSLYTAGD